MTKTEVRDLILTNVFKSFESNGFKIQKGQYKIYRKTDFGWFAIGLALIDYNPLFRFDFNFSIRHNIVETVIEELANVPTKYRNLSATLCSKIHSLTEQQIPFYKSLSFVDHTFEGSSKKEIEDILASIQPIIDNANGYFEKYKNLEEIHQRLNVEEKDEMAYPRHGYTKLVLASYCDRQLIDAVHLSNKKKIESYADIIKTQYLDFYHKLKVTLIDKE